MKRYIYRGGRENKEIKKKKTGKQRGEKGSKMTE